MFHTYYLYIALLPSVILHEVSHGWVANFFGDPTAKDAKRLSLNPMRAHRPLRHDPAAGAADRVSLPAVRVRPAGAGQRLSPAKAASTVALRVAGRPAGEHRALGHRPVSVRPRGRRTSSGVVTTITTRLCSTSVSRWASRTFCSRPSICSRFRRSTVRPSSNDSSRTSTSAPTTTTGRAPYRSSCSSSSSVSTSSTSVRTR